MKSAGYCIVYFPDSDVHYWHWAAKAGHHVFTQSLRASYAIMVVYHMPSFSVPLVVRSDIGRVGSLLKSDTNLLFAETFTARSVKFVPLY
jgi:hypothetical protein